MASPAPGPVDPRLHRARRLTGNGKQMDKRPSPAPTAGTGRPGQEAQDVNEIHSYRCKNNVTQMRLTRICLPGQNRAARPVACGRCA